jgi:hypothetical protein
MNKMPKPVPVPKTSGYPNNIPNTQTQRTRGTKNTTRGNSHSKKMG